MITFPNAKINIGLNIIEKRSDGFHNIETVFYPIKLSDILEINISETNLKFENTGLIIDNKDYNTNLCYKAYEAVNRDCSMTPVNIHLHKKIPFGAGLGGGSSDASFTLKMLNSLMQLNLSENILVKYAENLGSDCPFFVLNKPTFAKQKGNSLKSIELNLKGYFLVLVHPGININTAKAYSEIIPVKPEKSLLELIDSPIEEWKDLIKNDFEETVFKEFPEISNIKNELYKSGAVYASMSGSGSSVYGIFKNKVDLKQQFNKCFIYTELL
ncbi:MAG: 4-(cytidine 5'-diphospho)-2-C-methyl-D-erythritol kinase [Bacteroidales bacterium]|nr:4-(cytidine 5'-diphospho)-2-C-methyl-D-erythritol kinase [Bacteroidales bacterium]